MLTPEKIKTRFYRYLLLNVLFVIFSFSIAIELYIIIWPLVLMVFLGYLLQPQIFNKKNEFILAAILMLISFTSFMYTGRDGLFGAGSILLTVLVALFYREKSSFSSYSNLLAILGAMILATFLMDRFYYFFFFITFIWLSTNLLFLWSLQGHLSENTNVKLIISSTGKNYSQKGHRFLGQSSLLAIGFLIMIFIFILIPRTRWDIKAPKGINMGQVGFSKKMSSSSVSSLLSNPKIYFTVRTKQLGGYFKGVIYDHYSNTHWETKQRAKTLYLNRRERKFVLNTPLPEKTHTDIYQIYNYTEFSIFYRDTPYALRLNRNDIRIKQDKAGNISALRPMRKRIRYFVTVSKTPAKDTDINSKEYLQWVDEHYLQLPKISERVLNLAKGLVKKAKSNSEKAQAIVTHLKAEYPYTLRVAKGDKDIADFFLFKSKRGYCLHFATAMTVMLRSQGVPARVVGGFRGGDYDIPTKMYIVSNENAHAWVEVFIKNRGWVTYDPTPPQQDYLAGLEFWRRIYFHFHMFWSRNVLGFSRYHQNYLWKSLKKAFFWLLQNFWLWLPLLLMFFAWKLQRQQGETSEEKTFIKRIRKKFPRFFTRGIKYSPTSTSIVSSWYCKMVELLRKLELNKQVGETAYEFEKRAKQKFPELSNNIDYITNTYCAVRFAHKNLDVEKKEGLAKNIKKIENRIKKR